MPSLVPCRFVKSPTFLLLVSSVVGIALAAGGCGGGGGGRNGTGGSSATGSGGSSTGSGGASSSGGSSGTGTGGGTPGSGGATASGGASGTGSGGAGSGTGGGASGSGGSGSGGGASGSGGAAGGGTSGGGTTGSTGGSTGGGGAPADCAAMWTGDAKRPQLTDSSASCYTIQRYLAQAGTIGALATDNWDPTAGLPAASTLTPMFTVAKDGSGTHTSIQAAIIAAKAVTGGTRVYILVQPDEYRELVCVDGTTPITLYGADSDASKVTIAFDNYSGKTVDATKVNACSDPTKSDPAKTAYGTSDSTTVFVKAPGFQAMNLTIANDTDELAAGNPSSIQAVALTTQGDKSVFQNVHLVGNQDTLQVKTSSVTTVARMYFKDCAIDGDTDFIFGRATAVFDGCTLTYVAGRKTNSTHISPSTEMPVGFGFLIINSKLMGGAGISGTTYLGRAWDDSSGTSPNGQAIIRESTIAAHVNVATPWTSAASSSRAFDATMNRLYEYKNTGPGAAP